MKVRMKVLSVFLMAMLLLPGMIACSADDPFDDMWTQNIFPAIDDTYDIGSPTEQYQDGYFVNLWASNNVTATSNMTASYFIGDGSQLTGIEQGELMLYFLNGNSPDVAATKRLSSLPNDAEITLTGAGLAVGNTLMGTWITDANVPNIRLLEGNMRVHVAGRKTGGTKNVQFYYEVWKCNTAGADIELISTSEYTDILTNVRVSYNIWALADETMFNASDRIKVKGYAYVTRGGSAPTVEAYIQGASLTRLVIPVGAVSVEKFVPYDNAVDEVTIGTAIWRLDGSFAPASLADASAVNNSIYYSTDSSKLCYKDSSGVAHELY